MDLKFVFGNPIKKGKKKKKGKKATKKVAPKKKTRNNKGIARKDKSQSRGRNTHMAKHKHQVKKKPNPGRYVWTAKEGNVSKNRIVKTPLILTSKELRAMEVQFKDAAQTAIDGTTAAKISAKKEMQRINKLLKSMGATSKARKRFAVIAKEMNSKENYTRSFEQTPLYEKSLSELERLKKAAKSGEEKRKIEKAMKAKKVREKAKAKKAAKARAKAAKKATKKKATKRKPVKRKPKKKKATKKKGSKRRKGKTKHPRLQYKLKGSKFSVKIPKMKKKEARHNTVKVKKGKRKGNYSLLLKRSNPLGGFMTKFQGFGKNFKNAMLVKADKENAVSEALPLFVGGAVNGSINKVADLYLGKYLRTITPSLGPLGVALPALLGTLIEATVYAGLTSAGKLKQNSMPEQFLKGMIAANIVNLGNELVGGYTQMIVSKIPGMSGVNFTPMRGVQFTPAMRGVNYTPNMRGTAPQLGSVAAQLGRGADFGRNADFGKMGEYEESPSDFGHGIEGDVSSEDEIQLG